MGLEALLVRRRKLYGLLCPQCAKPQGPTALFSTFRPFAFGVKLNQSAPCMHCGTHLALVARVDGWSYAVASIVYMIASLAGVVLFCLLPVVILVSIYGPWLLLTYPLFSMLWGLIYFFIARKARAMFYEVIAV